jgi:hypothetical protein
MTTELVVRLGNKNMTNIVKVSFYVEAAPQLSSGWPRKLSTWSCWSELLGKGVYGPCWMGNFKLPTCADRELWHLQCDRRHLANPVAFFEDREGSLPFLILYEFDLQGAGWRNGDKFYRDKRDRIEQVMWTTRDDLITTERLRKELLEQLKR